MFCFFLFRYANIIIGKKGTHFIILKQASDTIFQGKIRHELILILFKDSDDSHDDADRKSESKILFHISLVVQSDC